MVVYVSMYAKNKANKVCYVPVKIILTKTGAAT